MLLVLHFHTEISEGIYPAYSSNCFKNTSYSTCFVDLIPQPLLSLSTAILLSSLIDTQETSLTIKCDSAGVRIVELSSARLFQEGKTTRHRFQWKGIQALLVSRLPSMHSCPHYPTLPTPPTPSAPKSLKYLINRVLASWKQTIQLML